MDSAPTRERIREAIERLPLDSEVLRRFHDAFLFRRSIPTTDEARASDEVRSLAHALEWALTSELGIPHAAATTAVSVPESFKIDLIRALALVAEPPLSVFSDMVEDLGFETRFADSVADALIEYAAHAENALNPEPW